ncbi:apoptosis regulator BAX-like [Lampris incognitus]|uniref:apoptosis regulator BAX-like n=1 Tax=Lampris incognitus TaxID=2546036 RepID=UPI0024B6304D|nr:apoptosis regulator BAX-like [Lampris incognitus]
MACEGNDERIGEALIKEVIEEELKEVPSEEVPAFTPLTKEVKTEQEKKIVVQLGAMIRIIGDRVKDDREFQDAIDGMASGPGCMSTKFGQLVNKVFDHGQITWERIAVLFYVAGRMAVRLVEANLPQSVPEILRWILNYFRTTLLGWIRDHGGWINSFSALACAPMNRVSTMNSHTSGFIIIFIAGVALGSIITWKLAKAT